MVSPVTQNINTTSSLQGKSVNPENQLKESIEKITDPFTLQAMLQFGLGYDYLNNKGNTSGELSNAPGPSTDAPAGRPSGLYIIEGPQYVPPPPVAANQFATATGDPHFTGFNGSAYDFHGQAGQVFNLLSDAHLQVNALFAGWGCNGATVINQLGILSGSDHLLIGANGQLSLNGNPLYQGSTLLENGSVNVLGNGVTSISTEEYLLKIYDRGDYLDLEISTTEDGVNADGVMPDGVMGQTASGDFRLSNGDFVVNDGIFGTHWAHNMFGTRTKVEKLQDKLKEKYHLT